MGVNTVNHIFLGRVDADGGGALGEKIATRLSMGSGKRAASVLSLHCAAS